MMVEIFLAFSGPFFVRIAAVIKKDLFLLIPKLWEEEPVDNNIKIS